MKEEIIKKMDLKGFLIWCLISVARQVYLIVTGILMIVPGVNFYAAESINDDIKLIRDNFWEFCKSDYRVVGIKTIKKYKKVR